MHFSFKSFLIIIFIFSCSSEVDKGIEANLLISPDYNFSIEFFECNLNEGYTLLNLESFLSDLTRNEKTSNFATEISGQDLKEKNFLKMI